MSNVTISQLPVAASTSAGDLIPIQQGSVTKQLTNTKLFTNATLVAPALGTPASGVLTNCTGLPVATGVSGLGASVAAFLATPSSANLATAVTGETGSGALVFATSPTLATPTLTTPTMTAPVLGTVTSGNISACTSTSMVMVTPVLGAASATSLVSGLIANTAVAGTIASAATVAPTAPVTIISGTAAIDTITAPAPISTTGGTITFIPTSAFTWTTAGNIAVAGTAVVSRALTLTYDATTVKWYPSYV